MTNYQMAWWPANYAAKAQADSGAWGSLAPARIVGHGGRLDRRGQQVLLRLAH